MFSFRMVKLKGSLHEPEQTNLGREAPPGWQLVIRGRIYRKGVDFIDLTGFKAD